jgi:hypothetical protein
MAADGQTASADNCTLNALSGSFSNGGGGRDIRADGVIKEALSDVTFNNGATDNSQQEIVLDPESLEAGTTYDLRIYVCNSSGQNRQVNLSFVGDDQGAVETGWFNEDDARTSAGGFKDPNQAYYIDYRFTWDGETTPGVTISQKSGAAPFVLYALTNQVVPASGAGIAETKAAAPSEVAAEEGKEGGEGLQMGMVSEESDQVGVSNDDFYASESLNNHGRWVELEKWGKCWQPTGVAEGWRPYTNGSFKNCDDCGWTFVSDEPWAWAAYHYGRWAKVDFGCGWVWVPGKTWAGSWVSWRKGHSNACECVGWAPLPPEVGCDVDVGVSSWVDETYNIGPDFYTFVNVGDFGSDSYAGCSCIWDTSRNSTVIIDTFNCTNISLNRWGTYCGGIDVNWCNTEIRRRGGKECGTIIVDRWDNPGQLGGKYARLEGNRLGLVSPRISNQQHPKHPPKIVDRFGTDKIDHGWKGVKDPKIRDQVKSHIAQESKGKTPKNTHAQMPTDVAGKMKQHRAAMGGAAAAQPGTGQHPGAKNAGGPDAGTLAGQKAGSAGQHPGGKNKAKAGIATGGAGAGAPGTAGGLDQHPGGKNKMKAAGGTTGGAAGASRAAGGFDQHPGKARQGSTAGLATQDVKRLGKGGPQGGTTGAAAGGLAQHPGQKQKRAGGQPQPPSVAGGGESRAGVSGPAQTGGKAEHRGKKTTATQQPGGAGPKQAGRATGGAEGGSGQAQGTAGASGQGQGAQTGAGRRAGGEAQTQSQGSGQAAGAGASGGQQKHHKQQLRQAKAGQSAGGGGGQGRTQEQAQQQPQQLRQAQASGQSKGGGGGGGGQAHHARKQAQQQQLAQQQQAQQQKVGQQQARQQQLAQQQQQAQQQKVGQQQQLARQQQLAQQQQLARQQQQQQRGKKGYATPIPKGY